MVDPYPNVATANFVAMDAARKKSVVLAALGVGAALCILAAVLQLRVATGSAAIDAPATAVLSPRRAPEALASAAGDARARAVLTQLVATSGLPVERMALQLSRNGTVIEQANADAALLPASALKLITGAAVLDHFGGDHRFTTTIQRTGEVDNGVLNGNLYLVGGGDPLLLTGAYSAALGPAVERHTALDTLADDVVRQGIRTVNGNVFGNGSVFDRQVAIPTWSPAYAQQGQVGAISGVSVNQGFASPTVRVAVADPEAAASRELVGLLAARGVAVTGFAGAGTPSGATATVSRIDSAPVSELVDQMLTYSDNTTAEILLKDLGRAVTDRPGTTASGLEAVRAFLKKSGGDSGFAANDGSGLDRNDRANCTLLDRVMTATPDLREGLPDAGVSGTLKDRMGGTAAVGKVSAKTGTLNDVSSLVGYAAPTGAPALTFCLMSNGIPSDTVRGLQDRIAVSLASLPPTTSAEQFAP